MLNRKITIRQRAFNIGGPKQLHSAQDRIAVLYVEREKYPILVV